MNHAHYDGDANLTYEQYDQTLEKIILLQQKIEITSHLRNCKSREISNCIVAHCSKCSTEEIVEHHQRERPDGARSEILPSENAIFSIFSNQIVLLESTTVCAYLNVDQAVSHREMAGNSQLEEAVKGEYTQHCGYREYTDHEAINKVL